MANVMMPNKKGSTQQAMSNAGTIIGGVVGGVYGGPAGAVEGAGAGGAIGDKVGGVLGGNAPAPQAVQAKGEGSGDAMKRRMEPQEAPAVTLEKADEALQQLPPQYGEQYGPMIRRARMLEEQQRGIA